jgi:DNA transformation protein
VAKALSPYCEYILDLLQNCGDVTIKRMFGGYGVFKNTVITAIIVKDELYLKVDSSNQKQFEKLNSEQFSYESKDKVIKMSYWKVPLEIIEDHEHLEEWFNQSYYFSLKSKK